MWKNVKKNLSLFYSCVHTNVITIVVITMLVKCVYQVLLTATTRCFYMKIVETFKYTTSRYLKNTNSFVLTCENKVLLFHFGNFQIHNFWGVHLRWFLFLWGCWLAVRVYYLGTIVKWAHERRSFAAPVIIPYGPKFPRIHIFQHRYGYKACNKACYLGWFCPTWSNCHCKRKKNIFACRKARNLWIWL